MARAYDVIDETRLRELERRTEADAVVELVRLLEPMPSDGGDAVRD